MPAARRWSSLPTPSHGTRGAARVHEARATISFRLGQNQQALAAYRKARSLYSLVGSKLGQGNSWTGEAEVLFRLGQNQQALAAYRKARSLFSLVGDKLGQGNSWKGEAEVLFLLGQNQEALRAAENAVSELQATEALPNEFNIRVLQARIQLAQEEDEQAMVRAEQARAILVRWRRQGGGDQDRTAMADTSAPYDLLIPHLARTASRSRKDLKRTLFLVEEAHAPVLLDLLTSAGRLQQGASRTELVEIRARLTEERQALLRERAARERELARAPRSRKAPLRASIASLDDRLDANELALLGTEGSRLVNGKPIDAGARHRLVRAVGPVLIYYVADSETVAILLRPDQTPMLRRVALSWAQLHEHVRTLRGALSNPIRERSSRELRRRLYDRLVGPFAEALAGARRLTIIPHGPLHELPFESLLLDDESPAATALFERWHLSVAPSLSALEAVRARRRKRQGKAAGLAFLGIAGTHDRGMPAMAVQQVGALFGSGPAVRVVLPNQRALAAYRQRAGEAEHLMVATHGVHVPGNRSSYLALAADDGYARHLTATEIARTPLRATLVTLAACETARGQAMLSDERLDLTRAFLIAGAGAVLATRWNIPDQAGIEAFLRDFYSALQQGMRTDEALTQARRMSRKRDPAQIWAAWVLVGDAR